MVCPDKTFGRIALATEEPGLPWAVGGDTRHFIQLAHVTHRVGGVWCASHHHQRDLVFQNQIAGHFSRAVGIGLAVFDQDFNAVFFAGHSDAVFERLLHLFNCPFIGFTEQGQRSGQRGDKADFDGVSSPQGGAACGSCHGGGALNKRSAIQCHACLLIEKIGILEEWPDS